MWLKDVFERKENENTEIKKKMYGKKDNEDIKDKKKSLLFTKLC